MNGWRVEGEEVEVEIEGFYEHLYAFVLGGSEFEVKSGGIVFNCEVEKKQILDATLVANEVGLLKEKRKPKI